MLFFLRTVSLRHFRLHLLRTSLTILGIALGITVFVGIDLVNKSTLKSFYDMINNVAGRAQIEISRGRSGFPEYIPVTQGGAECPSDPTEAEARRDCTKIMDAVAQTPGVAKVTALVRSSAFLEQAPQDTLILLGVDTLADKDFRTFTAEDEKSHEEVDALQFLNDPDSALITDVLAKRYNIKKLDKLRLATGSGIVELTVRGVLAEKGAAKVFGGSLIIMDVYSAQTVLKREGRFDQIDLILKDGAKRDAVLAALRTRLGAGYTIDHPGSRSGQVENMLKSFQQILSIMSLLALFVGMFLIYNTFSMAVAQRRREIGILRALGVSADQVRNIFLFEAFVLGALGAAIGAVAGYALARELTVMVAQTISTAYFKLNIKEIKMEVVDLLIVFGLGTVTSMLSSYAPARHAAKISPLEAMSPISQEAVAKKHYVKFFLFGVGLMVLQFIGLSLQSGESNPLIGSAASMLGFLALTLIAPILIIIVGELFSPILKLLFSVEGKLGSDNLTRAPGRTSVTVSALMIGIALSVAVQGTMLSFQSSVLEWLHQSVTADLVIKSSNALPGPDAVDMPESLGDELLKIEGVADVNRFRMVQQEFKNTNVVLYSVQMPEYRKYSPGIWIEGQGDEVYNRVTGHDAVYVSENFMNRFDMHTGKTIELKTPSGVHTFEIAGVRVDYMSDQGVIGMDRATFKKYWKDNGVDSYDVFVANGTNAATVRDRVTEAVGGKYRLVLQTNAEYRKEVQAAIEQSFTITYAMEAIAIIIAIIGIINTLMVSVLDRTREIGMLRAIGFTKEQIRKVIVSEAGVMGVIAGFFGAVAGVGFTLIITQIMLREVVGWSTPFVFPERSVATGFLLAVGVSMAAGFYPAWKAASTNIIRALEYE
jgi:putative ABC transport system permease protein